MMGECELHNGLHNYDDYGYLEVENYENGFYKIIGTNLNNYAMPLIRYDTGDLAKVSNASCECGRSFPLIKKVVGRKDTPLIAPSGQQVPSVNFYTMFEDFHEISLSFEFLKVFFKLFFLFLIFFFAFLQFC